MAFISKNIGISPKKLFAITIINAGTISWFMFISYLSFDKLFQINRLASLLFPNLPSEIAFVRTIPLVHYGEALFYFFAVLSAIIGSSLSQRIDRKKLLMTWISLGVLSTGLIIFVQNEFSIYIMGSLLGISLGLGFPYSLSYLSDCTKSEQRGRVSGIVLLQTFIMLAIAVLIVELIEYWFIGILIVLMIIRLTSMLALFLDKSKPFCESINERKAKRITWLDIVTYRRFVLYFVPWMLFIVASVIMEYIIWPQFEADTSLDIAYQIGGPLHYLGTAICGVISGILADRIGRKTPTVIGLTLLGISFVLLKFPINIYTIFANLMAVGMAFGFLMVVSIAVPGDLAFPKSKERFYALIIVLPLSVYGGLGAIPRALNYTDSGEAISLILIILLFMLIIPVWLSEESLSSKKMKERKLREHMKKVKELIQKD